MVDVIDKLVVVVILVATAVIIVVVVAVDCGCFIVQASGTYTRMLTDL